MNLPGDPHASHHRKGGSTTAKRTNSGELRSLRYAGRMSLIKRIQKVKFRRVVNEGVRIYPWDPAIKALFGDQIEDFITAGKATDVNLTLEVSVGGFPTREEDWDGVKSPRVQSGSGAWQLSQASFEAQKIFPVELTAEVHTPSASIRNRALFCCRQ